MLPLITRTGIRKGRKLGQAGTLVDSLTGSEDDLQLLAGSLHDQAVFVIDSEGRILSWPDSAERISGFPAAEVLGQSIGMLYLPEDASGGKPARDLAAAYRDGQFREEGWRLTRAGAQYWAEAVVCRLRNGSPDTSRFAVLMRDVSERRSLQKNQEERISASHTLETLGHLTAGVAHDLNNLLMIVGGYGESLRSNPDLGESERSGLEQIAVAAEHGSSLTSQLLAFSGRAASSGIVDLHTTIVQTTQLLRRTLGDKVQVELDLDPHPVRVKMGHGKIGQILINLAINARDAMPRGGTLLVRTRIERNDRAAVERGLPLQDYVRLEIRDSGEGMTPEVAARAFDPFFTTKPSGQGSGLGLATVRALVSESGGDVQLITSPGAGTMFRIWLPEGVEGGRGTESSAPGAPPRGYETILVVEDEPAVREIIVTMLESLGYTALEAGTAHEALALMERRGTDVALIVTDVAMPQMSGVQLMDRLQAIAPATKCLFISGVGEDPDWQEDVERFATNFLQKPFTRLTLAARIRSLLGDAAARPVQEVVAASSRAQRPWSMARPLAGPDAQRLVDALPAPVFVVQDTRFVYVNNAFANLLALERHQLVGHDSLDRVHPDHRTEARQHWSSFDAASGHSVLPVVLRCGDGCERTVVVGTTPILFGGARAILGTCTDVTGQPDALTVASRMAALGRLAGGVAHEFNNLLLVIGGQLEKLQHALSGDNTLATAVEAIGAKVERATHLTDQLLSFGRRQMLTPQVTDLATLVRDLDAQLRGRAGASVTLALEDTAGVPPVRADRPRLRQVLRHLVDNARDAMPSGGRLTIAIDAIEIDAEMKAHWAFLHGGGRFVRMRVIDTGAGMPDDVMPHVFEPFFTTKGKGKSAGMGLASVYGIVKQSAGFVFVERTGPEGTCITVLLPPHETAEQVSESDGSSQKRRMIPEHPRVLLVEDDAAVRELFADVLTRRGFAVTTAATAEHALTQAEGQEFDVLLTDVDLPGMNGAVLAATLRPTRPGMALVLTSGFPDDGTLADAGLTHSVALLRKPFSIGELISQIHDSIAALPAGPVVS